MDIEKIIVAVVIVIFAFERLTNTFGLPRRTLSSNSLEKRELRFTSLMLALYSFCVIGTVFFYFYFQTKVTMCAGFIGGACLFSGCLIRRASIFTMGANWSVYTVAEQIQFIVTSGPFKYSRHPYYWASMLELIGLAALLSSAFGFVFSLMIYFPLLVYRSILEERNLEGKFHSQYTAYKQQTRFFIRLN